MEDPEDGEGWFLSEGETVEKVRKVMKKRKDSE